MVITKVLNLLLIIIGTASAVAFMTLTHDGYQQKFILKHFSIKKIETEDAKITLFLKFGLYFALFSIALKLLRWILSVSDLFKSYTATIQRILLNSYDYFIIFMLLLFYLLRNKTGIDSSLQIGWNIKEKVPLFGFWFISSRIVYAVGYLLTTLTGLNFKVPGVALIYGLLSLMVAETLGFNGFKLFNTFTPYLPQL